MEPIQNVICILIKRNVHHSIQQYSSVASSHQNKELFEITNSNGKHETDRVDSTPSNRFWLKSFPKRDRNAILLCNYFVGPSNFIIELKPNADSSKPVRDSVSSDEFVWFYLQVLHIDGNLTIRESCISNNQCQSNSANYGVLFYPYVNSCISQLHYLDLILSFKLSLQVTWEKLPI